MTTLGGQQEALNRKSNILDPPLIQSLDSSQPGLGLSADRRV